MRLLHRRNTSEGAEHVQGNNQGNNTRVIDVPYFSMPRPYDVRGPGGVIRLSTLPSRTAWMHALAANSWCLATSTYTTRCGGQRCPPTHRSRPPHRAHRTAKPPGASAPEHEDSPSHPKTWQHEPYAAALTSTSTTTPTTYQSNQSLTWTCHKPKSLYDATRRTPTCPKSEPPSNNNCPHNYQSSTLWLSWKKTQPW